MLYGLCAYLSFCNCIHSVQIQFQTTAAHKKKTDTTSPPLREVGTEAIKTFPRWTCRSSRRDRHGLAQGLSPSLTSGLCHPSTLSHGPWTMFRMVALRGLLGARTGNLLCVAFLKMQDVAHIAKAARNMKRWSLITLLSHFLEIVVFQHW